MKPTARQIFFLFALCLFVLAGTSSAIEGKFVTSNAMMRVAELERDPARKEMMLKAAAIAAQSVEIHGDSLVKRQGDLTTSYKITEHGPFLLGTVNYPDGSTGYCSVYVKDEDTLIVGDTKFTRSK